MSDKSKFSQLEEEMMQKWQEEDTFAKSLKQREGKEVFSFYDGPPFANGLPHYGHILAMSIKDSVTRYKTMQGYYVPRKLGWDTHGLPVEYEVEKDLDVQSKNEIEELGIDKFTKACRDSVFRYKEEWSHVIERMGRWAEKGAYATLDDDYIESIWWVFKQIWDKGLVYKGYRSMPYCPRCATPLSNFELIQGYEDGVEDPSIYVEFEIEDEDYRLLAWTTTPWTLPGNAALGVNPDEQYVEIAYTNDEDQEERLVLAKSRLEIIDADFSVEREFPGRDLVGKSYQPLFELDLDVFETNDNLYQVWEADFVNMEDGTGIVHIAPAFGEDDLNLGLDNDIPVLQTVDANGHIKENIGLDLVAGKFFKGADKPIIKHLTETGHMFAAETTEHTYPFCWRCESPLLYYALDTWFVEVTKVQDQLLDNNQQINWIPEHIKRGRFGNWLENVQDWNISRNRYWGAPLPVWQCGNEHFTAVGSLEELKEKALNPNEIDDLHRPAFDQVKLSCEECGQEAARIEEVFDCWFESGSMPYAQDHYPFKNKDWFEQRFPADFIAEGIDQTRGWFYTLHVLGTILFDSPTYQNVIVNGHVMAADGKKLSKRLRNYPEPSEIFDSLGVDSLRFFLLSSPVVQGENVRFSFDHVKEVNRNVFNTLWNVQNFYQMYADVDEYRPDQLAEPDSDNVLDQWIISKLNQTIQEVTEQADKYQLGKATRPIREFIDDLSNWYVRRSRRRFWKSGDDSDKTDAYQTLHYVLVRTAQIMAPWSPFMSDQIYRNLRLDDTPKSVHLTDWPSAHGVDSKLLQEMKVVREVVSVGLDQRAQAGIKVRQPLQKVTVIKNGKDFYREYEHIILQELNVKELKLTKSGPEFEKAVELDTEITPELKREGLMRDVIRRIQSFRKKSGLEVDDRIHLQLATEGEELREAIEEHQDTIAEEVLATKLEIGETALENQTTKQLEDSELKIALEKV